MSEHSDNNSFDYAIIRSAAEKFISDLLFHKVLCLDLLSNASMRSWLLVHFINKNKWNYLEYRIIANSILQNVIQTRILEIPYHSKMNLDKYIHNGLLVELDDEEYLKQSLDFSKGCFH